MRYLLVKICLLLLIGLGTQSTLNAGYSLPKGGRTAFYEAMASTDTARINQQIAYIRGSQLSEKDAYLGALLMKKSEKIRQVQAKLSTFKSGRAKLESAIKKEPANGEFRFIRFMIQEHCPPALKYNTNLQEDLGMIKSSFGSFPEDLKKAVLNYCKISGLLKPDDL